MKILKAFRDTSFVKGSSLKTTTYDPYTPIAFSDVEHRANSFADLIEERLPQVTDILLEYESFEVVTDEITRTLDLLRNLKENSEYFVLRVNEITTFLPKNQPLYAFVCFAVVPSLMAHSVHFRIPHAMRHFFPALLAELTTKELFPNICISDTTRLEFLKERSAVRVNPETSETRPVTDAVIFTGTSAHADQLRLVFDTRTLFIANGAGHNPVVVSKDADIASAVNAVLTLQLYNQGQDCAAPNAILVHTEIFPEFLEELKEKLKQVGVGHYRDTSNRVGPLSEPHELMRVQDFLLHNRTWLDPQASGIIRSYEAIIEPTIISKPLSEGGNFSEIFAPIIFLQEYSQDPELSRYFEDSHYARNAMYIALYGSSDYVRSLVGRKFDGKILHDATSILINHHLHEPGVERGTKPYGGNGYGASSLSINGKITSKATLPQRDIYEQIAKPLLQSKVTQKVFSDISQFNQTHEKNVEKLLHLSSQNQAKSQHPGREAVYIDVRAHNKDGKHSFVKLDSKHTYTLLSQPDVAYIATLLPQYVEATRSLLKLLERRSSMSLEAFGESLYGIARSVGDDSVKASEQMYFFQHVYQMLFGVTYGPRLMPFLFEIDLNEIQKLLDI